MLEAYRLRLFAAFLDEREIAGRPRYNVMRQSQHGRAGRISFIFWIEVARAVARLAVKSESWNRELPTPRPWVSVLSAREAQSI